VGRGQQKGNDREEREDVATRFLLSLQVNLIFGYNLLGRALLVWRWTRWNTVGFG
jgi:hypothetical protein